MVSLHRLGLLKVRNFNCWSGSEGQYASSCQICADRSNRCRDIVILIFLGCRPPLSWVSLNFKFVTDRTVTRAELRHPDLVEIAQTIGTVKFLTVEMVERIELHHPAKYRQNRSS